MIKSFKLPISLTYLFLGRTLCIVYIEESCFQIEIVEVDSGQVVSVIISVISIQDRGHKGDSLGILCFSMDSTYLAVVSPVKHSGFPYDITYLRTL